MSGPDRPAGDVLRPSAAAAAEAWASRVRAGRAQIERLREVEGAADFYAPMASRFARDPRRSGDEGLGVLRRLARSHQTWLDIGAGGGRYTLPLALQVRRVHAVEPSASMVAVLRAGMAEFGIDNVSICADAWPMAEPPFADVALMAHVGYDIEDFGAFLDAAESVADRCVVIMRATTEARASHILWPQVHGESREACPTLRELIILLIARGVVPDVTLVDRGPWGYESRSQLLASARRLLWLRPGSAKDRALEALIDEQATERDDAWELDWPPMQDGIVTWTSSG